MLEQLPPETRSAQARRFNDEAEGSPTVLVASDAIGMGLNLNIRRVVFASLKKCVCLLYALHARAAQAVWVCQV